MTDYLLLLIGTVLVNNFVLVQFLGLCPFMGVSSRTETAIGMSFATTFVMTLASLLSYLINNYIVAIYFMFGVSAYLVPVSEYFVLGNCVQVKI